MSGSHHREELFISNGMLSLGRGPWAVKPFTLRGGTVAK